MDYPDNRVVILLESAQNCWYEESFCESPRCLFTVMNNIA